MDEMGLSDEFKEALLAHLAGRKRRATDYLVWHENELALSIFSKCRTQWNFAPSGRILGLDYAAVIPLVQMIAKKNADAVFEDIQLIESGALKSLGK